MPEKIGFVKLVSESASFRVPQMLSGFQMSLQVPAYSSILGLLAHATGREIKPEDTRIGYRYTYKTKGRDLEKIHRWGRKKNGTFEYNKTAVREREVHYGSVLYLFLTNLKLHNELLKPLRTMKLGRSQDIAFMEDHQVLDVETIKVASLNGSLIPMDMLSNINFNGILYNLPEHFNYKKGYVRRPSSIRQFFSVSDRREIAIKNLKRVSINNKPFEFYLHEWGN